MSSLKEVTWMKMIKNRIILKLMTRGLWISIRIQIENETLTVWLHCHSHLIQEIKSRVNMKTINSIKDSWARLRMRTLSRTLVLWNYPSFKELSFLIQSNLKKPSQWNLPKKRIFKLIYAFWNRSKSLNSILHLLIIIETNNLHENVI